MNPYDKVYENTYYTVDGDIDGIEDMMHKTTIVNYGNGHESSEIKKGKKI